MGIMDRFRGGASELPTTTSHSAPRSSRDPVLASTPPDSIVGNPSSYDHDAVPYQHEHTNRGTMGGINPVTTGGHHAPITSEKPLPNQPVAGNSHTWNSNRRTDEESGMGVHPVDTVPNTTTQPPQTRKHTIFGRLFDRIFSFSTNDPFGPRPTLLTWLKMYWGEILTLFLLGMLSLGLLIWSPLPRFKYFPVYTDVSQSNLNPGDELVYPQFAAPKMSQHIPIVADALVAVFTPFIVVWLMNIFVVHSFWDVNNACMGTVISVMTGCVIQIIIKLVVVGLRPHFLTVCNPMSPSEALAAGVHPKGGFGGLFYTVDVCREKDAKKLANAMQSFPSGHSSAAWAGLFYCALYLNGKLKPFSNYHPAWWKFLLTLTPLVMATLMVGSLTLDMSHNWYDIAVGSAIGVLVALGSYRMTYASIFDWRWSHVPLPRGNVYMLGGDHGEGMGGLEKGWVGARALREGYRKREGDGLGYSMEEMDMWSGYAGTRRGGWRRQGGVTAFGAPGDSSAMWRGMPLGGVGGHGMGGQGRYTGDNGYRHSGAPGAGAGVVRHGHGLHEEQRL